MNDSQIRSIIREEIQANESSSRFKKTGIGLHKHNNLDSPSIDSKDIVVGVRAIGSVTMATNSTDYLFGLTAGVTKGNNFSPTTIYIFGNAIRTSYTFIVTAANATQGAVYSNNGGLFGVTATIAGATTLVTQGSNTLSPAASGTLTKVSGIGDATITFSSVTSFINARANVTGMALLGPSFNFQPQTTTSVTIGPIQPVSQGSSYFLVASYDADTVHGGITPPMTVRAAASETHLVSVAYSADVFKLAGNVVARATVSKYANNSIVVSTYVNTNGTKVGTLAVGWEINATYVVT